MTLRENHDDGPSRDAAAAQRSVADWARRPVSELVLDANALTVDVEDYFQVEAFSGVVDRDRWSERECRIERNVDRILEMFANAGVHGTFFTLGWIATRYPSTVRKIVAGGHELASHGLAHHRADKQSTAEFLRDVAAAKNILEDTTGVAVNGYRAASFSIAGGNLWAFDALEEAGYRYSSSLYPIRHDFYGMPEAPRFAFYPLPESDFIEIPVTTARRFGANWPCGGGGYFRLLPYWLSAHNMRSVKRRDGQPCVFYFHPWEIDPGQPRVLGARLKARMRHYTNIGRMQARLERLLKDFRWKRLDEIFPVAASRV
jgi:polysaccharide deacetylase family protein (PEP-CTERM system associated)